MLQSYTDVEAGGCHGVPFCVVLCNFVTSCVVSGSMCNCAQTSRLEAFVMFSFIDLYPQNINVLFCRFCTKGEAGVQLFCAVLCYLCCFVQFCVFLCQARRDVRFFRLYPKVEAGGRCVVPCCVVLCRFVLFCMIERLRYDFAMFAQTWRLEAVVFMHLYAFFCRFVSLCVVVCSFKERRAIFQI